ncbi:hypothetical protein CISIN_1g044222mg [Citrus sinensis]|uniref:Cytochrome P450 n=1 Tax=Citrus sinensis TaxID=2711 RepID=A0A067E2B4_CITSI|nr:hypothetical protein CISIN_1g044222mg [Citrus sinensis]
MELTLKSVAFTIVIVTLVTWAWMVLNWLWLRPKKLEKFLRQQGLKGNSYRLLFGDLKESTIMLKKAKARPLSLDDDAAVRVTPFLHKLFKDYVDPDEVPTPLPNHKTCVALEVVGHPSEFCL